MTGEVHYHVVAENDDGELICSDGFPWPGAHGLAADLISPANGVTVYEPVRTVWIIEGTSPQCPFAHGDGIPRDEEAASEFLERVVRQPPYWSA
jgi:hypothetical protein